jgi:hypothetical protein
LVKTIALTKIDYNARPGVSTANLTGDEHEYFRVHKLFNAKAQRRRDIARLAPQPNGNAFKAETPRTQRAAKLFL